MFACQIDSVLFLRYSCTFRLTTFLKVDDIFDVPYTSDSTVQSPDMEESG